jgi:hypothetical protein
MGYRERRYGGNGGGLDSDVMSKSVYDVDEDSIVDSTESVAKGTSLPGSPSEGDMFLNTTDDHLYICVIT